MGHAQVDDQPLDGHAHLISVRGELDMASCALLRRRVDAALADGAARLVVDLSRVTHMDSSGLAELISAQQRTRAGAGGLVLIVTSPMIRRTLEIRGVNQLFTIAASREDALSTLA
jgi:anti-sigma B factor antagonist